MGQKVNPVAFRLGVNKFSSSNWYASKRDYATNLTKDAQIRKFIKSKYKTVPIDEIKIERGSKLTKVSIATSRPGAIIGGKGANMESVKLKLTSLVKDKVHIRVEEIRKPDAHAKLVAHSIAQQLEKRASYRRVMKRSIASVMRSGAEGVKITISGRVNGAEIARSESVREGSVPLHTIKANLDYATHKASTTYGIIGVKVWINRGKDAGQ